jgi:preprotein translocase subunit SecF
MKYKYGYFLFSALFLVPGVISLILWGLKPAIDFTGGSILEIQNSKLKTQNENEKAKLIEVTEKTEGVKVNSIQQTDEESVIFRLNSIDNNKKQQILANLTKDYGETKENRFETVGPIIGQELIKKTIIALLLGAGFILLYITQRFHNSKYGICAILATFHDTFIMLGIFSILGHFKGVEVDTLFVTALLTILSFSVHDTVVVYDRIRESVKNFPKAHFPDLVNKAVAETLSRSVNNSMTIILMLVCLYLLGGATIKWFSFALLIGTISGTYSSTFTAAPLLVIWNQLEEKRKK